MDPIRKRRALTPDGSPVFVNAVFAGERFYTAAEARNDAMAPNLLTHIGTDSIVLTGGFHTASLARALKDNGISFVVVTPQVETMDQNPFMSAATGAASRNAGGQMDQQPRHLTHPRLFGKPLRSWTFAGGLGVIKPPIIWPVLEVAHASADRRFVKSCGINRQRISGIAADHVGNRTAWRVRHGACANDGFVQRYLFPVLMATGVAVIHNLWVQTRRSTPIFSGARTPATIPMVRAQTLARMDLGVWRLDPRRNVGRPIKRGFAGNHRQNSRG